MSASTPPPQPPNQQPPPEATALMLSVFADLYRQEVGAEEGVGIVIGALAYAAGRLPKWADLPVPCSKTAVAIAAVLLGLAVLEAGCVPVFLSGAIADRNCRRIGPETELRTKLSQLQAY